jgi:hypothetical protein
MNRFLKTTFLIHLWLHYLSEFPFTQICFLQNIQIGMVLYTIGLAFVICSVLTLKHLTHNTLLFKKRVKALGGFLESIEIVGKGMPWWWRLCMAEDGLW